MYIFMLSCYFLMFINFINLTLVGLSGYFNFTVLGASHSKYSLFMILIFTITETVVMYFFITTGSGIKEALESGLGKKDLWTRERNLKMKLFPQLMLTIFLVGGWFIHKGAVENNLPFSWLHGPLFVVAYLHHSWLLILKNRFFKEQIDIISELEPVTA